MDSFGEDHQQSHNSGRPLGLLTAMLGVLLAAAPAMYPGYWQSLEGLAPLFNVAYPAPLARLATVPDLWRGTGSAAFLPVQPFIIFGVQPAIAVRALFMLALAMGGLGVYSWLRRFSGDRPAGLAALLYVLLAPFLATVYVRGSVADALILALLPIGLAGAAHYATGRSPAAIGLATLATLWMWRTQAGLALFCTLVLVLYAFLVERDRLTGFSLTVAGLAGGLSLLPVRTISGPAAATFADHFVYLYQLFRVDWQTAPSQPGWQDGYPLQLGLAPVVFAIITLWYWMRSRSRTTANADPSSDRLLLFALSITVIAILLSLQISGPFWRLSGAERFLTYPWQILLPMLPFLAALAGNLPQQAPVLNRSTYWAGLAGLVIISSLPNLSPQYTGYSPPPVPVAVFGPRAELVLLEANITEKDGQATLTTVWQPLQPLPTDYNLFWQALAPDGNDNYQVLAQLDQQPLPDSPATAWRPGQILTGTYTLTLPPDPAQANLRFYFGFYDWRDGSRLPLQSGQDDKVVLYGE